MSFLNKLMDTMRLNDEDEDDYFLDDDYDDEEEERPVRRSMFKKQSVDYDDDYEEEPRPRVLSRPASNPKVTSLRRGMEVSLIKPTTIDDAKEICDYLLAGKAVVLNMEGIHTEVAQRIIDFTCGSTYSIEGNLQKISNYIFIATPRTVELSGDFQDLLGSTNTSASTASALKVSGLNIHL